MMDRWCAFWMWLMDRSDSVWWVRLIEWIAVRVTPADY